MAGMYPDDKEVEIYGEKVTFPGLNAEGKYTNGDFTNPAVKPSFFDAATSNLILDNLSELIKLLGGTPNNKDVIQLAKLFTNLSTANSGVKRDAGGRAKVAPPVEEDDIVNKAFLQANSIPLGLLKKMPQLFSGTFIGKNPINIETGSADTRWQICDGTAGTPDLRNKFIRGGTGTNQGVTGGADSRTPVVTLSNTTVVLNVTVNNHTLTVAQMPSHNHIEGYGTGDDEPEYGRSTVRSGVRFGNDNIRNNNPLTSSTGGTTGHTHSDSATANAHTHTATAQAIDNRPAYYTLAYIMYIG